MRNLRNSQSLEGGAAMSKLVFDLDMEKCVACGACAVACMDQNDIWPDKGDEPFRHVGIVDPLPHQPCGEISFLSIGCLHCADAPCIKACPVGCLFKNEMGLTVYDSSRCIGCHSCAMACPFGAPTYDSSGKMRKCNGCAERLANGMQPACVRICPTGALSCVDEEKYSANNRKRSMRELVGKKK